MYHFIVRHKLRKVFQQLNEGNYEPVLKELAPQFKHVFFGDHAFGGTRHTVNAYRRWFERLLQVFPDIHFEIKEILVKGWPWYTVAVVEWVDYLTTKDGQSHSNAGIHIIRFRWMRVMEICIYHDTQKLADICQIQAQNGIGEAVAAQILD